MASNDWRNGEYEYCLSLVYGAGPTRECPRDCVASYINMQHGCAVRDGRLDVAGDLALLLNSWVERESLWLRAHPATYDRATAVRLAGAGWQDDSYRNDIGARFTRGPWSLFIQPATPGDREEPTEGRFMLYDNTDGPAYYSGDDLDAALNAARG